MTETESSNEIRSAYVMVMGSDRVNSPPVPLINNGIGRKHAMMISVAESTELKS